MQEVIETKSKLAKKKELELEDLEFQFEEAKADWFEKEQYYKTIISELEQKVTSLQSYFRRNQASQRNLIHSGSADSFDQTTKVKT